MKREDLELLFRHHQLAQKDGKIIVWTGDADNGPLSGVQSVDLGSEEIHFFDDSFLFARDVEISEFLYLYPIKRGNDANEP